MGMGDLDGFGGRTPSSFVNPSSSTRSSWRCVLLRRQQKPGRVGLCHQTGRIRKSLVSVRCPRQIPTQNGDRGTRDGVSSHPSGLGVLQSHRFGFWTTPSLASLCDWSSPDSSSKLRPAFSTLTSPRFALLTEVLPLPVGCPAASPNSSCPPFHRPVMLLARDSEPSPFLGLALPCCCAGAGDFPRDALFGNQSILCAPTIHISNSPFSIPNSLPLGREAVRQIPSTASHRMHQGPGQQEGTRRAES